MLEKVPGLGPERRKLLLKEFGSVQRIKEATPEEISKRTGLSLALSQRIAELLMDS